MNQQHLIDKNIRIHDRIARQYEKEHGEIFNEVEQNRLAGSLKDAAGFVCSGNGHLHALDFGCGSGNLTRHLLSLGMHVTAADVSAAFLALVEHRHGCPELQTVRINGQDLNTLPNEGFDFIAMYSVLHHIPDYLGVLSELAGKCARGGVMYMDHERNADYWNPTMVYRDFVSRAMRHNWRKYLKVSNYVHKLRRVINPRHTNEGDIHVWPDDHIEWDKIEVQMHALGFETVLNRDYLHFDKRYRKEMYDAVKDQFTDMRTMAFRKR